MRHIAFIIPSLNSGGAERAVVLLAEGFIQRGQRVSLITIYGKDSYFYDVPKGVNIVALNINKHSPTLVDGLLNNISRILILRKVINSLKPDIVISFLEITNVLTLLALLNTKYPVIVNEQNNPLFATTGFWSKIRRLVYPLANKVVSCSQGVDDYFNWLATSKRAVIYNPLVTNKYGDSSIDQINYIQGLNPSKKWIVSMGRLTHQKGYDILLAAFQKIYHNYPDWQLIILGEGELRAELESKMNFLGLDNHVVFAGRIKNPFLILKQCELFVLSSRFEGFGNVLIEAMACGLPVISTDCPSGPAEIIDNGVDGILVPNEDASSLATAMEKLMYNEQERQRLANLASSRIERFELENIIDKWEELIKKVIQPDAKKQITFNTEFTVVECDYQYLFTVFTSTFNRASTLHRVYESLKAQTFSDFEWLIIDDGSTDNTSKIVEEWQKEANFPIRYIWQENQGKHIAFNRGVQEAQGKLFLTVDSDDAFVSTALEKLQYYWDSIPNTQQDLFAGVTVLCVNQEGKLVGNEFPCDITDSNSVDIHTLHGVFGEKWGFQRTDVLKKFPFPEISGEKFITEAVVWDKISKYYQTRFVNDKLRIYYEDTSISLSNSSVKCRAKNPKGAMLYYKEYSELKIPLIWKVKAIINYIRFSLHAGIGFLYIIFDSQNKLLTSVMIGYGFFFYLSDLHNLSRSKD